MDIKKDDIHKKIIIQDCHFLSFLFKFVFYDIRVVFIIHFNGIEEAVIIIQMFHDFIIRIFTRNSFIDFPWALNFIICDCERSITKIDPSGATLIFPGLFKKKFSSTSEIRNTSVILTVRSIFSHWGWLSAAPGYQPHRLRLRCGPSR
jgi:hypothetical protein